MPYCSIDLSYRLCYYKQIMKNYDKDYKDTQPWPDDRAVKYGKRPTKQKNIDFKSRDPINNLNVSSANGQGKDSFGDKVKFYVAVGAIVAGVGGAFYYEANTVAENAIKPTPSGAHHQAANNPPANIQSHITE